MKYSAEPVPSTVEPNLAQYLDRQFIQISMSTDTTFIAPIVNEVPEQLIPGGIIYVIDDGMYCCISTTKGGDALWRKIQTT